MALNLTNKFVRYSYGGCQSHGGTPKSSKSLDYVSIENHGDLGKSHFKKPPYGSDHACQPHTNWDKDVLSYDPFPAISQ